MCKEITNIEVIRFETAYQDGTLDFYTEDVQSLCKAFSLGLKIITQYVDSESPIRIYEIYLDSIPFFIDDTRNAIKTFILQNGMTLMTIKTITMNSDELIDIPHTGIYVEENLIKYKPGGSN